MIKYYLKVLLNFNKIFHKFLLAVDIDPYHKAQKVRFLGGEW